MDYLAKGRELAKEGRHEEALSALYLALENDQENPDTHFYIGLCFSSLEEFEYARYHYDMALMLEPKHEKTNLMSNGISHVDPKKPPEQRYLRKATAEERRNQAEISKSAESGQANNQQKEKKFKPKMTDEKWEAAFPAETLEVQTSMPIGQKILIGMILLVILGATGYFVYSTFIK